MASMGQGDPVFERMDNDVIEDDSYAHNITDSTPLTVNLNPPFKTAATSIVIIFQVVILIGQVVVSFVLPFLYTKDPFSILMYIHTGLWGVMMVVDAYLRQEHSLLSCSGYIDFYRSTKSLRRVCIHTISAGATILLLLTTLIADYCPNRNSCPGKVKVVNYVQLIAALEALVITPVLIRYLMITLRFNKNLVLPDVQPDGMLGYVQTSDVGHKDTNLAEDVAEKQADLIRYFRSHNAFLGKRILKLSAELNRLKETHGLTSQAPTTSHSLPC